MNKAIDIAARLACNLHKGQTDKAGKDYFAEHLKKVAEMGNNQNEIIVGYLHDAAEDTQYDVEWIMQNLNESLCDEDAKVIREALNLLNSKTASSREEYINRLCQSQNKTAKNVKLNDLRNNMDLSRIENPTKKDFARVKRYKKEYEQILSNL